MARSPYDKLSRRERQILDIVLELGEATAEEVRVRLPDPPGYSAVRAMLVKLEHKGVVGHEEQGLRYVYRPEISTTAVRRSALSRLIQVFFGGSVARAVTGIVDLGGDRLTDEEIDELTALLDRARRNRSRRNRSRRKRRKRS